MKSNHRILISFSAIIVFIILLNSSFNPLQIYLLGVVYNCLYAVLYNHFKTEESKDKEHFVRQFISNDVLKLFNVLLCLLSWVTPIINAVTLFYASRKCTKCKVSKLKSDNFGKYSTGRTRDICNDCHTGIIGSVKDHRKCKGCGEVKLSETNFGKSEAGNIKAYYHECTDKNQNYRVCSHCKSDKHISKFTRFPNGKLYQRCQDCKDNKVRDPYKPKYEKRIRKEKTKPKPKEKLKVAKKDDGVIDRNIMSFEYQNKQRLSAEEVLAKAKKQNEENIKSGKYKAVAYGSKGAPLNMVRSVTLKRV